MSNKALDPTDRPNRLIDDVFWARYQREPDRDDAGDRARLEEIVEWIERGCRLPSESAADAKARLAVLRLLNEQSP